MTSLSRVSDAGGLTGGTASGTAGGVAGLALVGVSDLTYVTM